MHVSLRSTNRLGMGMEHLMRIDAESQEDGVGGSFGRTLTRCFSDTHILTVLL